MFGSGNSKSIPGVPYDVQRVYNCLTPKPKELLVNAYQRRFIRDGEIGLYNHKERRTKKRHLFLFNDVLLIAKNEGKNKFWLKVYISLRTTLRIEDVPDTSTIYKVEFRIYAPKRTFIMFTKSEPDKMAWIKDIKAAIAGEYSKGNNAGGNSNAVHVETSSNFERRTNIEVLQDKPKEEKKLEFSGDIGTIDIPGMDFDLPAGTEFQDESDSDDETTFSTIGGGAPHVQQANVIDFLSQPTATSSAPQQPVQHQPMQPVQHQPMASPIQPAPFSGSQPFANSKPLTPMGMLEPTKADASPTINSGPAQISVNSADPFSALKGLSAETPQSPYGGMQQQPAYGNAGMQQQPYGFGQQQQQPQYNFGQQQPQYNFGQQQPQQAFGTQQQPQQQQNQPYQFGQF